MAARKKAGQAQVAPKPTAAKARPGSEPPPATAIPSRVQLPDTKAVGTHRGPSTKSKLQSKATGATSRGEQLSVAQPSMGDILHAMALANHLSNLRIDAKIEAYPDGIVQGVAWLIEELGLLLVDYLVGPQSFVRGVPPHPQLFGKDQVASDELLGRLLRACQSLGVSIGPGTRKNVPDPSSKKWCATTVRDQIALELERPHKCDSVDCPLGRDSFGGDAAAGARAFLRIWETMTTQPFPVKDAPFTAAISNVKNQGRWKWQTPTENAEDLVVACLGAAGWPRPSQWFDRDRKRKNRADKQ